MSLREEASFQAFFDLTYEGGRMLVPNPSSDPDKRRRSPRVLAREAIQHPEFRKKAQADWQVWQKTHLKALDEMRQGIQQAAVIFEKALKTKIKTGRSPSSKEKEIRRIGMDIERRLRHLLSTLDH